jgi:hypothetical protein
MNGGNGTLFPPNGFYYGAAGGGGIQYISTDVSMNTGFGGESGGGMGVKNGVRPVNGNGSKYGAGGGGTGGGQDNTLTGNDGFPGCVFLYWNTR